MKLQLQCESGHADSLTITNRPTVRFYYRKSVNVDPFGVNVSKSGVGYSVGGRGFRTGVGYRMNLAVHGLEGDIRHGGQVNSYYDDPHKATGQFDFVLANPPFNVNAVDKERLKDSVGPARRFPFGLPRTDNANYLWIQLFHSALNAKGRAARRFTRRLESDIINTCQLSAGFLKK